jgi:hypothetical protein
MPKKYRLLKDLPGFPKGTIFHEPEDGGTWSRPDGSIDSGLAISPERVANNPAWFTPIPDEPERPYPWKPKEGEDFWMVDAYYSGIDHTTDHGWFPSGGPVAANHHYRTSEDAKVRLKVEPSVNAAVKAIINRGSWVPKDGEDHYKPEFNYQTRQWQVGPCECHCTDEGKGDEYPTEQDCQAYCDLLNLLASPPHEQQ